MSQDSLRKRYSYKVSTNVVGLIIGSVTQVIIPRGLGPKAYGDFNFLSNFFTEFVNFFDMGASIGFYTKLSQRPKESKLISFYFYFIGIIAILVMGLVAVSHAIGIYKRLWPEQLMLYVYLAAFLTILSWIAKIIGQMTDAYGLTVPGEVGKVIQKIFGLLIIIFIFIYNKLNLLIFFFYNYLILFLLIAVLFLIIRRYSYALWQSWKLTSSEVKRYLKEFYQYSHPLFVYSLVGMFIGIFDRWMLQVFGGSIQQGFFSLSFQIGTLCFLFTSAMTPLIMREFSIAHNNRDLNLLSSLFHKYAPVLYSITAYLACFTAANADKVTLIIGGGRFKEATLTVAIMSFYPIHQTYGQLNGSLFYATGKTKLYRNIGILFMLIGLPLTYFLIASRDKLGLNIGAPGLAIKIVILQFIAVNTQLFFNVRFLKLSFWKYLLHQIAIMGILFLFALVSNLIVDRALSGVIQNIFLKFALAGVVYTMMVIIIVYYCPIIFGIQKSDFNNWKRFLKWQ